MKYIVKRSDTDYLINTDERGGGGFNVVPRDIDPYNSRTIEEVEAYIAEHPDHVLDLASIESENLKNEVRQRRDAKISRVEWRVRRHQDETALGLEPTENITPVLEYIQALREVPQQTGFPSDVVWPTLPPEAPQ